MTWHQHGARLDELEDLEIRLKIGMQDAFGEFASQIKEFLSFEKAEERKQIQEAVSEFVANSIEENNKKLTSLFKDALQEVKNELLQSIQSSPRFCPENQADKSFPSYSNPNFNNTGPHFSNSRTNTINSSQFIKLATYDGTTSWSQFERHFEITAYHNQWTDELKATHLATSLRGKAQAILETLSSEELLNISKLKETLNNRFGEQKFSRMFYNQLQARVQSKEEDFAAFAEEIERLTRLAYLNTSEQARDRIACLHFINGLRDLRVETTLRREHIESLQTAVERALELKAINDIVIKKRNNQIERSSNFQNSFDSRFHPNQKFRPTFSHSNNNSNQHE